MTTLLLRLDDSTIIVMNTIDSPEKTLQAIRAGRWVPPEPNIRLLLWTPDETPPAFKAVSLGNVVVITPEYPLDLAATPDIERKITLTPRQSQVMTCLVEGCNDKEIALRLGMTQRTVAFHIREIKNRLGATSRTELVRRATMLGYTRRKK